MLREDFGGMLRQILDSRAGNSCSVHSGDQDLEISLWRSCDPVSLHHFLPNPHSSAAQSKQARSLQGDVVPGFARPQHPPNATPAPCSALRGEDQPYRPRWTRCRILGRWNACAGPIRVPTLACTSQLRKFRRLSPAAPPAFLFQQLWFSHLLPAEAIQANDLWGR